MKNWKHLDLWRLHGKNFAVEVSRHTKDYCAPGEGQNGWCVYAYIYPDHPHFKKFDGDSHGQAAACDMPLHGGPTYLRYHRADDGTVCSIKVGCDYSHLYDERYSYHETMEDAITQFHDAEKLFAWLENYTEPAGYGGGE